jgi:hypothetical protein
MMCNAGKKYWVLAVLLLFAFSSPLQGKKMPAQNASATVKLIFVNNVKGKRIVFADSAYTNPFGETYRITKLRYYVTNVSLQNGQQAIKESNSYHLIDEARTESQVVVLRVPAGDYAGVQFLLGVDSLHNVSGAQSDDLDPAKDMFWTWNTGYVMAKMEGNSPDSKVVNNKFEFHIGGFSGPYNVLKPVRLDFAGKNIRISEGKTCEIVIEADIDAWWQHPHDIKISEHATITSPGPLARQISDNYVNMFHIKKINSD